ncbi:hypothetical protein BpHYR1_022517 [Brachionus plicatilis]|uniref:Uncharacterized protein n=1 Tax=Brachionus plicatilis TaxID=10195 RepID=A0A3M7R3V4_BRAPC|nr:hypothetical protein BpHYR1_022517 [Brachionus plicatilis]
MKLDLVNSSELHHEHFSPAYAKASGTFDVESDVSAQNELPRPDIESRLLIWCQSAGRLASLTLFVHKPKH